MKLKSGKIIFIFCLISFLVFQVFTQDTNSSKYLQFKTGNIWVYNWIGTGGPNPSGKVRLKITGTIVANGHLYYVFDQTGTPCTCAQYTYSPFLFQLAPFRVDSVTGNFMKSGSSCQWQINENLIDSLRRRVGDIGGNSCNTTVNWDTNSQNIFGTLVKTKYMGVNIPTYFFYRRYAYGRGLVSSVQGCYLNTSCSYTLSGCVINGIVYGDTSYPTGLIQISTQVPEHYSLFQNYPNPFNPATEIKFNVPAPSPLERAGVRLVIYNNLGEQVQILVDEELSPGTYEVEWDGSNFSSGVYYYTLTLIDASAPLSTSFFVTKRMMLIK